MSPLPSSSNLALAADSAEERPARRRDERVARVSEAPQGGRWWFAFDRWAVVAEADDEFVLA